MRFPFVAALATLAASCGGSVVEHHCSSSSDCPASYRCVDMRCVAPSADGGPGMDAGSPTDILSIRVDPPSAMLLSTDGSRPTQSFTLIGTQRDGRDVPVPAARWGVDSNLEGDIASPAGVYTANGAAGGVLTVTGTTAAGDSAHAMVTVDLRRTVLSTGVDTTALPHFDGTPVTDPSAIDVLYPLEGAVMPANVYPPTIQWSPVGAMGDLFRVRITEPHVEVVAVLLHTGADFGHGWLVPRDTWRPLVDSATDMPLSITVDRFETATSRLIAGASARTMRLAHGNVFGAVYYENRDGRANILRIDTETATLTDLIPNPYPNSAGTRCVGCHALTHDGRWAFGTNAETEAVYDLTVDLTTDPPPTRFGPIAGPSVASFDQDGTHFVGSSHVTGGLTIYDAATGAVTPSTGLATMNAGYASWSPDGMHIAYPGDIVVAPDGDPQVGHPIASTLYVADRAALGAFDFAAPRAAHVGSSLVSMPEGGNNDAHPAWSPDSMFVAFQHGTGTFTHVVRNPGALYLLGTDGSVHRLDHASNGATGTDGYWPTFAPYVTSEMGGRHYYWMAFYARRDYGNALLGTQGTSKRQLWVAAIDTSPTAGTDPSFVPYWLPGQDRTTSNFSAFWAPEACRATGAACSSASECCSGRCEMSSGEFSCASPPPSECHLMGDSCGSDADCCSGLSCVGNVCTELIH